MKRVALAVGLIAIGFVPLTVGALLVARRSGGPAGDSSLGPQGAYRGSRPPVGSRAPDFRLKSYRGADVRMRGLRGKVVLVTFLDTRCTTKCPVIATILGESIGQLPESARRKTVALAISVDPKHDTPESARSFLRRRHTLGRLRINFFPRFCLFLVFCFLPTQFAAPTSGGTGPAG